MKLNKAYAYSNLIVQILLIVGQLIFLHTNYNPRRNQMSSMYLFFLIIVILDFFWWIWGMSKYYKLKKEIQEVETIVKFRALLGVQIAVVVSIILDCFKNLI